MWCHGTVLLGVLIPSHLQRLHCILHIEAQGLKFLQNNRCSTRYARVDPPETQSCENSQVESSTECRGPMVVWISLTVSNTSNIISLLVWAKSTLWNFAQIPSRNLRFSHPKLFHRCLVAGERAPSMLYL
jgi:hypothetical protein